MTSDAHTAVVRAGQPKQTNEGAPKGTSEKVLEKQLRKDLYSYWYRHQIDLVASFTYLKFSDNCFLFLYFRKSWNDLLILPVFFYLILSSHYYMLFLLRILGKRGPNWSCLSRGPQILTTALCTHDDCWMIFGNCLKTIANCWISLIICLKIWIT